MTSAAQRLPGNCRAALAYASRFGWLVFPLHGKLPAVPKREGGRGFLDGTTDGDQIERWWRRWPNANVGIAAGLSGLVVADIDPRNEGDAYWADLVHGRDLPTTPEVLTGGGGQHYYFRGEAQSCVLGPGIEVKAGGGYVVAPPGIHPDTGRLYAWEASGRVDEVALAPVPEWLGEMLRAPRRGPAFEHSSSVDPRTFALGAAFKTANMLGTEIRPGVFAALCPNAAQHTQGRDFDGSTVIFAPPPGKLRGWFHCSHGHCAGVVG